MGELFLGVGSAAWLGVLTAISPCPLASNIAAITFISRRVERPGAVLGSGLLSQKFQLLEGPPDYKASGKSRSRA